MAQYEYMVVPAPTKGLKARGVRTPQGRFANALQSALNLQGADGWEYLRAELLPSEERTGLASSTTNWRNVLVFRRLTEQPVQELSPAPVPSTPDIVDEQPAPPDEQPAPPLVANGAERMLVDDGVEEISPVMGMTTALRLRAEQQSAQPEDSAQAVDEDPKPPL